MFFVLSLEIIYPQNQTSKIKIAFNPTKNGYWMLEKNNYGKNIISQDIEYQWELNTKKSDFKITLSNAYDNSIALGESFVKHEIYKSTYLKVGRYYRDFSTYLNDNLSSGSILISKNSQAMPKIGCLFNKNLNKNKNISFNLGLAHGLFETNDLLKEAPFLHEKFIYMNIMKEKYKISIGLVHEAIWNGKTDYGG